MSQFVSLEVSEPRARPSVMVGGALLAAPDSATPHFAGLAASHSGHRGERTGSSAAAARRRRRAQTATIAQEAHHDTHGIALSWMLPPLPLQHWWEAQEVRHEIWSDLFYDLVFVAATLQLGNVLKASGLNSWRNFTSTFLLFVGFFNSWLILTLYQNRFHTNDILHKCWYMMHTAAVLLMCVCLDVAYVPINALVFSCTLVAIRVITFVMYVVVLHHNRDLFSALLSSFIPLGLSAALLTAAIIAHDRDRLKSLWTAAYCVEAVGIVAMAYGMRPGRPPTSGGEGKRAPGAGGDDDSSSSSSSSSGGVEAAGIPLHIEHLSGRFGALMMIVMGESIIQLILPRVYVTSAPLMTFLVTGFLLVVFLAVMFFDMHPESHVMSSWQRRPAYLIWMFFQLLACWSVFCVGVGIKVIYSALSERAQEVKRMEASHLMSHAILKPIKAKYRWLLAGGVGASLLCFSVLRVVHKPFQWSRARSYSWRFVVAGANVAAPLFACYVSAPGDHCELAVVVFGATSALLVMLHDTRVRFRKAREALSHHQLLHMGARGSHYQPPLTHHHA